MSVNPPGCSTAPWHPKSEQINYSIFIFSCPLPGEKSAPIAHLCLPSENPSAGFEQLSVYLRRENPWRTRVLVFFL